MPAAALERLAELPLCGSLLDGMVCAAHGRPASPWKNLLGDSGSNGLVSRPDGAVLRDLEDLAAEVEVVVVGHTHAERVVELGGRLLVNVGPVNWQTDGDPRARWTLLTFRAGRWAVDQRRVVYGWHAAARAVMADGPVFPEEVESLLDGANQHEDTQ